MLGFRDRILSCGFQFLRMLCEGFFGFFVKVRLKGSRNAKVTGLLSV